MSARAKENGDGPHTSGPGSGKGFPTRRWATQRPDDHIAEPTATELAVPCRSATAALVIGRRRILGIDRITEAAHFLSHYVIGPGLAQRAHCRRSARSPQSSPLSTQTYRMGRSVLPSPEIREPTFLFCWLIRCSYSGTTTLSGRVQAASLTSCCTVRKRRTSSGRGMTGVTGRA